MSNVIVSERLTVHPDDCVPSRVKIREVYEDKPAFENLVQSICKHGVMQEAIGRYLLDEHGNKIKGKHGFKIEIGDGGHRLHGAIKALERGFEIAAKFPVQIGEYTDEDFQSLQFIMNNARLPQKAGDIKTHIEKIAATHIEWSNKQIADFLVLSPTQVSNYLRLKRLTEEGMVWAAEHDVKATKMIHWARLPQELQPIYMEPDQDTGIIALLSPSEGGMAINDFIDLVDAVLSQWKKTGKKPDSNLIISKLKKKKELDTRLSELRFRIANTKLTDEENELLAKVTDNAPMIELIIRTRELEEVLQVDAAYLKRKTEQTAANKAAKKAINKVKELTTEELKAELASRAENAEVGDEVEVLS